MSAGDTDLPATTPTVTQTQHCYIVPYHNVLLLYQLPAEHSENRSVNSDGISNGPVRSYLSKC